MSDSDLRSAEVEVERTPTTSNSLPRVDSSAFTDFVDRTRARVETWAERAQEVDAEEVASSAKNAAMLLVDNALAGEWLDRGELYGALQIVLALMLLRSPGLLDGLFGFVVGPATLIAGALVSGKAVVDLGIKQLSIWPAPVPGAELRTDGLYGKVRHPLYAGLLLAALGFAAGTGSPERLALTALFAYFLTKKMDVEERYLKDAYPEYDDYVVQVPSRIIPGVW